ncbi:MAG: hypothetical protein AAF430_15080 [Myxococcota bacterium]
MLHAVRSRALAGAVVGLLTLAWAGPAVAGTGRYWTDNRPYYVEALNKLNRGFINIATAPTEIYSQAYKEGLRASIHGETLLDIPVGTTTGGFVGVGAMFIRFGLGTFDLATFFWPTRPWIRPATPAAALEDVPPRAMGVDLPEGHR